MFKQSTLLRCELLIINKNTIIHRKKYKKIKVTHLI